VRIRLEGLCAICYRQLDILVCLCKFYDDDDDDDDYDDDDDDDDEDDDDGRLTVSVRQAKAREAREQRRAQLTAAHNFVIGLVAEHLDVDHTSVEEFIVDNGRVTLSVSLLLSHQYHANM